MELGTRDAQAADDTLSVTTGARLTALHDQPANPWTHSSRCPPVRANNAPRRFTAFSDGSPTFLEQWREASTT
eukprot:1974566-Pleurochrysis_carterae.AAC.2